MSNITMSNITTSNITTFELETNMTINQTELESENVLGMLLFFSHSDSEDNKSNKIVIKPSYILIPLLLIMNNIINNF